MDRFIQIFGISAWAVLFALLYFGMLTIDFEGHIESAALISYALIVSLYHLLTRLCKELSINSKP